MVFSASAAILRARVERVVGQQLADGARPSRTPATIALRSALTFWVEAMIALCVAADVVHQILGSVRRVRD